VSESLGISIFTAMVSKNLLEAGGILGEDWELCQFFLCQRLSAGDFLSGSKNVL
jgi:hypothetical protein